MCIRDRYKGTATYLEKDEDAQKVVIKGDGRDTRGAGNASATITAQLSEISPDVTNVNVRTELTITGKVAQFGRGAISDVSGKLMTQFAQNLEQLLEPSAKTEKETAETDTKSNENETTDNELNLLSVVAIPVLKRFGIPIAALAIGVFMVIRYAIL